MVSFKTFWENPEEDYRGQHQAPTAGEGSAPLWDLTQIYPDDIYSSKAAQYYGDASPLDKQAISIMHSYRNRPDAKVTIYRAVPSNIKLDINSRDWVTTVRQYAVNHGEAALREDYKIIKKLVPAKHLFTDANSIFEFGYDPSA